jgi:hypothetical protein
MKRSKLKMVTYQILRTACPNCSHVLFRGSRVIGPGTIKCKKCGTTVNTGLTEWNNLSVGSKIWQVIREFFTPTFFGQNLALLRIILSVALWVVAAVPLVLIVAPFMPKAGNQASPVALTFMTIFMLIGFLIYPVLLVIRIMRMIQTSNRFLATQEPPPM